MRGPLAGRRVVEEETVGVSLASVCAEDGAFARVVQEMRVRAGLTIQELAEQMGVSKGAVHQYLYRLRGDGGTSTLRWFLRCASVCRCEVTVKFPAERTRTGRRYGEGATWRPDDD
jgi:transcriptional regulator with XRE-family HTH domain